MTNSITGYPFVAHVDQTSRPTIVDPKEFLKQAYVRFYTNNDNLINNGTWKSAGYSYNFRPLLKKFLFKQYGSWREAYAPNKTLLRKVVGGPIERIMLLED